MNRLEKNLIEFERELKVIEAQDEANYQELRAKLVEKYGEEGVQAVENKIKDEAEASHKGGLFCSAEGRKAWNH